MTKENSSFFRFVTWLDFTNLHTINVTKEKGGVFYEKTKGVLSI
jgi:hypothetical protein